MNTPKPRTPYPYFSPEDFRNRIRNLCTGRPLDAINGASHAHPCVVRKTKPPERKHKEMNPKRGTAEYAEKLQRQKREEAKRQGRSIINVEIELSKGGAGHITCKEMKCDFPTRNVTASVSCLVAESIERLRAGSDSAPPLRPARFWPYQQKPEVWEANYPIN